MSVFLYLKLKCIFPYIKFHTFYNLPNTIPGKMELTKTMIIGYAEKNNGIQNLQKQNFMHVINIKLAKALQLWWIRNARAV